MYIGSILTNIALGGAAGAAFLKFIDWLLSDRQRKQLGDTSVTLWNWIDEIRAKRLVDYFSSGRAQLILTFFAQALAFLFVINTAFFSDASISTIFHSSDLIARIASMLVGSAVGVWIEAKFLLRPILRWLSSAQNQARYLIRCYVVSVGVSLTGLAIVLPLTLLGNDVNVGGIDVWLIPEWQRQAMLGFVGCVTVVAATFMLVFVLSVLASFCMLVARLVFSIAEFVARRIAESPKGPLLSGSALLGGVAAMIKVFL
jgi:hypothetical protein